MQFLDKLSPFVHWGMRLSLAATFIYHGVGKFPPDEFAAGLLGGSVLLGWAVAIGEVAAGVLLIIGAFTKEIFTRLGGVIVVVIMLGAIYLVRLGNGWNISNGGMEFDVLMLTVGLYFAGRGNKV